LIVLERYFEKLKKKLSPETTLKNGAYSEKPMSRKLKRYIQVINATFGFKIIFLKVATLNH
jgi:hypothetical protein